MNRETAKKQKSIYKTVIFSLIFLFNPNISVIDILPDFIAYFLLARVFLYAADRAPHFEEARIAFRRLGWLNFLKFFGLLIMIFVKSENSSENDIIPLVTLIFAVFEILLMIIAIQNTFNALFYLGNRADAVSTIAPFYVGKFKERPEDLKSLTYLFAVLKCFLYFIPTPFLLTSTSSVGKVTFVKSFIIVLISSNVIGIIIGIIWLVLMRGYVNAVKKEGLFFPTLDKLLLANRDLDLSKKIKLRSIITALSVFSIASLFTLELSLVENYDVNLLPHFIYALILIFAVYKLAPFTHGAIPAYISGGIYFAVSLVTYVIQTSFLTEYGYARLLTSKAARAAYPPITVMSIIEFISLLVFLAFIAIMLRRFILENTGINESSSAEKSNESYYGSLLKKNFLFLGAGILAGLIKLISVILHGSVKIIYSSADEEISGAVVSPAVEWIGLAVAITAFIYIGVTLYFISTLKDEVKMRYESI